MTKKKSKEKGDSSATGRFDKVLTPEMLKSYKPTKNRIRTVNPEGSEKAFQFIGGFRKKTGKEE